VAYKGRSKLSVSPLGEVMLYSAVRARRSKWDANPSRQHRLQKLMLNSSSGPAVHEQGRPSVVWVVSMKYMARF
jgi:hypothetical protein